MRDNNEGNGRLKKLENGGRREINFFLELLKLDGKKKECSRAKDTPSLDYIDCVDLGEMCIIDRGEGNYSRKKNYFDGVVICVKSANRLFESQPFQLARNITPLFCSKR